MRKKERRPASTNEEICEQLKGRRRGKDRKGQATSKHEEREEKLKSGER